MTKRSNSFPFLEPLGRRRWWGQPQPQLGVEEGLGEFNWVRVCWGGIVREEEREERVMVLKPGGTTNWVRELEWLSWKLLN